VYYVRNHDDDDDDDDDVGVYGDDGDDERKFSDDIETKLIKLYNSGVSELNELEIGFG